MLTFLRANLLFLPVLFTATATAATDTKPQSVATTPPAAAPAFLDVVTFNVHQDGETHPLIVTTGPTLLRVDEPVDRLTIIYNSQTDHYIGLEHNNYTYWEFSWPDVRTQVESSQRYASHLRDLGTEGINMSSSSADTNAPGFTAASASAGSDNSGYVWRPTTDKKKITGLDCVRWTGDTVSGESVEAWCVNGPLPKMQAAFERLRAINEPIALVPVRSLVPSLVFPIYDALVKGGVTPVLIKWGGERDKNSFAYVESKTRDGKPSLFTVPKVYMKTTLVTMDGILNPVNGKK
jgi:hypothetical protein